MLLEPKDTPGHMSAVDSRQIDVAGRRDREAARVSESSPARSRVAWALPRLVNSLIYLLDRPRGHARLNQPGDATAGECRRGRRGGHHILFYRCQVPPAAEPFARPPG